jgi:hypothetical protein
MKQIKEELSKLTLFLYMNVNGVYKEI